MCPLLQFKTKIGTSALPIGNVSSITSDETYQEDGQIVILSDIYTFDHARYTSTEDVPTLVERFNQLAAAAEFKGGA